VAERAERSDEPRDVERPDVPPPWWSSSSSRIAFFVGLLAVNAVVAFVVVDRVVRPKELAATSVTVGAIRPGELFFVDDVVVNPAGTRASRHLRVSAAIEYDGRRKMKDELDKRGSQLRDVFISELSRRTVDELVDERVREEIREELLARANRTVHAGEFTNLYFTEYVIQ
jgi:flagellar basal body-associated protein FliL